MDAKLLSDLRMYEIWKIVLDNQHSLLKYTHPTYYNQTLCLAYGRLVEKAALELNGITVKELEESK